MVESDTGKLELRIERGSVSEEELAALTVVLCSVMAQRDEAGGEELPDVPPWRPERSSAAYRSPYHWR
ncbi:acyl-CoA carboxylase subunit epsilon [Streptomyces sp. AP-93]|uniref:acyl-CoA carboxylase subunit epsilon n=1 Tax=Streptomyces sp. AP-93 TaxID=2929048 RepID=UPI001FAF8121|nr:acyl-CoA carboxylase subunit epsilon [Streptomyces sp. AP-93]MCJ0871810.1 acyl-CoA carboxylase subunit epsilon [Streptomyces sp. AP-93]